jgi:hypothetical protein
MLKKPWRSQYYAALKELLYLKTNKMKEHALTSDNSGIFLAGAIMLANVSQSDLWDYALKATISGAIWLVYKLGNDYLSERIKNKKNEQGK